MSSRTTLTDSKIDELAREYPGLPDEYLEYLRSTGWGTAPSGRAIYRSPLMPEKVYGEKYSGRRVVLLGDDFQGFCLAYDLKDSQFGELTDAGEWQPWPSSETFVGYVSE